MGDVIIIAVLAAIVAGIVYKMLKDRRSGRSACGCDCSRCGKCCSVKQE